MRQLDLFLPDLPAAPSWEDVHLTKDQRAEWAKLWPRGKRPLLPGEPETKALGRAEFIRLHRAWFLASYYPLGATAG